MESIPLFIGASLAIGAGLITHALASTLFEWGKRWTRLRASRRNRLVALGFSQKKAGPGLPEEIETGLAGFSWTNLYAISALLGLAGFAFLGSAVSWARFVFLSFPLLSWALRRYLVHQQRRFLPGQVRQLLIDVRIHMSLASSLLLGLENISRTTQETSAPYRQLGKCLAGGLARSGVDVIQSLASSLQSPHLQRVYQRILAAQQSTGVAGIDQALAGAIDELNEEIQAESEEQIQHLPLKITLLATPFLLGPIVILLFYPLVDRILKTLAGTAIGGGF